MTIGSLNAVRRHSDIEILIFASSVPDFMKRIFQKNIPADQVPTHNTTNLSLPHRLLLKLDLFWGAF